MNKYLAFILMVFSVLSGFFIYSHHQDLNPDGISYLEIAANYKNLQFKEALNAYWSPVFSWVLIPFMSTFGAIAGAKILQFIISIAWIYTTYLFAAQITTKAKAIAVTALVFLFSQVTETWKLITPDLLLANYLNIFLFLFLKQFRNHKIKNPFLMGLYLGLGTLIKAFFLPFAVLFVILLVLVHKDHFSIKKLTFLFLGLGLIPVIWGLILSTKYDRFVFNTSGSVAYQTHVLGKGFVFLRTPFKAALGGTSFWYDPSDFSKITFDITKQIKAVQSNLIEVSRFFLINFHIGILLFLFFLFKAMKNSTHKILLTFFFLWILIYSSIFVENRYLWPIIPIFLLGMVTMMNKKILALYFVISAFLFFKAYIREFPPDIYSINHFKLAERIKTPCTILSDTWQRGLYVSYLAKCQYYGVSETAVKEFNDQILAKEIEVGNINYFIAFKNENYVVSNFLKTSYRLKELDDEITIFKTK